MKFSIYKNPDALGQAAAKHAAETLRSAIEQNGKARIVLSTGASQNETLIHLLKEEVEWAKVEAFHLDEYVDLPGGERHPASFRRYLKERFLDHIDIGNVYFVQPEGHIAGNIAALTEEIRKEPIDLAFIGIGENAHIAFNDPPADFQTQEAYIVVDLDEACKRQQVGEGCFPSVEDVPDKAISMTVKQIMSCRTIISCVPDKRKAAAIKNTLEHDVTPEIPATMLKRHPDWYLYLDEQSASEVTIR